MRWVITGAGSGFGRALARHALAAGDAVFATDVDAAGLVGRICAGDVDPGHLEVASLDLRDPGLVRAACARAASGPVDVLVNNAGYAVFGALGALPIDDVAALFDANVLGTLRVTQAMLPAVLAGGGTVVNVSSVAGRMVFPESGAYAATKYAVEALSEALYLEHCHEGLRVVVVEPGAFDTGFAARAQAASPERRGAYAAPYDTWDARKVEMLADPQDPARVAAAIWAACAAGPAFRRIVVGDDAEAMLRVRDADTPDGWVHTMAARLGGPEEGDVVSPDAVLSEAPAALARARLLADAGMLGHWAGSSEGRRALARLGNDASPG